MENVSHKAINSLKNHDNRDSFLHLRITPEEKTLLRQKSKKKGYAVLSEYIRHSLFDNDDHIIKEQISAVKEELQTRIKDRNTLTLIKELSSLYERLIP